MSFERLLLIISTIFISFEIALLSLSLYLYINLNANPTMDFSLPEPISQVLGIIKK